MRHAFLGLRHYDPYTPLIVAGVGRARENGVVIEGGMEGSARCAPSCYFWLLIFVNLGLTGIRGYCCCMTRSLGQFDGAGDISSTIVERENYHDVAYSWALLRVFFYHNRTIAAGV